MFHNAGNHSSHRRLTSLLLALLLSLLLPATGFAAAPSVAVPAPAGLVSWWAGNGSATDPVSGNNGTFTSGAYTAGYSGQAFSFPGSTSVSIADTASLRPAQFTESLWFNWDNVGTSTTEFLIAKGLENYEIHLGGGAGINGIRFIPAGYANTGVDATNAVTAGWHHLAVTYSGSEASIYVDGVLKGQRSGITGGADLTQDTSSLLFGKRSAGVMAYHGKLDEVLLFNRVLSVDEIVSMYNARSASITTTVAAVPGSFSAVLHGAVNANDFPAVVQFEYGTTTSYGKSVMADPVMAYAGDGVTAVSANLSGLASNTLYHFRLFVQSDGGWTFGPDLTFTTPPTTATALVSNHNPSAGGQSVTITATVTPAAATGTVTFKDGATTIGSGTLANGSAALTIATLADGNHGITAVYGGDTTYQTSTSPALIQIVAIPPSVTAQSALPGATTATLNGTVNANNADTTVSFEYGLTEAYGATIAGVPATVTAGSGATPVAAGITGLTPETLYHFRVKATNGVVTTHGTDQTFSTLLADTTTSLTSDTNPSRMFQTVTLTATVTPAAATGTVTFKRGATELGSGALAGGSATLTTSALGLGDNTITAVYGGDSSYTGSTSAALTQTVVKADAVMTLSSMHNPSGATEDVLFIAEMLVPYATGNVTFKDGATLLGTSAISMGVAQYTTNALSAGSHSITAVYSGDADYNGVTSAAVIQIVRLTSTVTIASDRNPCKLGETVTFTGTVSPAAATGTLNFYDLDQTTGQEILLGSAVIANGTATLSSAALALGTHGIRAAYSGDSTYYSSSSSYLSQTMTNFGWGLVGDYGFSPGAVASLSLAFAPDGTPYVAVGGGHHVGTASVMKYDGTTWVTVGDAGFNNFTWPPSGVIHNVWLGNTDGVSLAFSPDGIPYVAVSYTQYFDDWAIPYDVCFVKDVGWLPNSDPCWADFAAQPPERIMAVYRLNSGGVWELAGNAWHDFQAVWNGTEWVAEAGNYSQGMHPSLAFAPDGAPWVAYGEMRNGGRAEVRRFDGTDWQVMGVSGITAGKASSNSLAFSPDGTAYLAYRDEGNASKASVMKFNGSDWVLVGNAGISAGGADHLSLAFAPDGAPYVALRDEANAGKATLLRFSGTDWLPVGGAGFSTVPVFSVSLAFAPDGTPLVAHNNSVGSLKADGAGWDLSYFSYGGGSLASLAFAADGTPWVAFDGADEKAVVKKLITVYESTLTVSYASYVALVGDTFEITAMPVCAGSEPFSGIVTFRLGAAILGDIPFNRETNTPAVFRTSSFLGTGNLEFTVVFDGSPHCAPTQPRVVTHQVVTRYPTTLNLDTNLSPTEVWNDFGNFIFSARVVPWYDPYFGSFGGTVTFRDGETVLGTDTFTPVRSAQLLLSSLALGTHTFTATYEGDSRHSGSTATFVVVVNKRPSATTIGSNANPMYVGDRGGAIFGTISVNADCGSGLFSGPYAHCGTITLKEGETVLGTGTSGMALGSGTFNIPSLSVGSHNLIAEYSGNAACEPSTSPVLVQVVNKRPSTTTLGASLNPVALGDANGKVSAETGCDLTSAGIDFKGVIAFKEGGVTLCSAPLAFVTFTSGKAECPLFPPAGGGSSLGLGVGSHTITAVYEGDGYCAPSSASLELVVGPPPTTLTAITRKQVSPSKAGYLSWAVIFAEPVSGLGQGNFALTAEGVSGAGITKVSGSGTEWLVTARTGSGDGTLTLSMVNSGGVSPAVSNLPFSGETYTIDRTAPAAPTVGGVSPTNDATPTWRWRTGGGGNGIFRHQLDSTGGAWRNTSGTAYTPATPLAEGFHTLYIQERDATGNWSEPGSYEIVIDAALTAPLAPTDLIGTVAGGVVTLSWSDNGDNEAGYRVMRRHSTDSGWSPVVELPADSLGYDDDALPRGGNWQYRVGAYNGAGVSWGATISLNTARAEAPLLISVAAGGDGSEVSLAWLDGNLPENLSDDYEIWRKSGSAPVLARIDTVAGPARAYLDLGLTPGNLYSYMLCLAGASEVACGSLKDVNGPSGLTHTETGGVVQLAWQDNSSDETGFRVYRRLSTETAWLLLAELPAGSTSYGDPAAAPDTTYVYRISAYNGTLTAEASRTLTTTGGLVTPDRFKAVAALDGNDLSWRDRSSGEVGYRVWRRSSDTPQWLNLTEPPLAADSALYSDTGAETGRLYSYQVCAVGGSGGSACGGSFGVNGPSGISALDTGSAVALAWTDNAADENRYLLYREETATPGFAPIAALPADTTAYSDLSAPAGRLRYRLCAVNPVATVCGPLTAVTVVR